MLVVAIAVRGVAIRTFWQGHAYQAHDRAWMRLAHFKGAEEFAVGKLSAIDVALRFPQGNTAPAVAVFRPRVRAVVDLRWVDDARRGAKVGLCGLLRGTGHFFGGKPAIVAMQAARNLT